MTIKKAHTMIPRYIAPSSWWEHIPIAMIIIKSKKPDLVVELGTHYGVSFFGFCEAAEKYSPATRLYAIDTWEGDGQAGYYDNTVYTTVKDHLEQFHNERAQMIRDRFENALNKFQDKSIDLLHIDGLHTYEAVKRDFEQWLPKVKDDGCILFHDWNVRNESFGVWKLWDEIKKSGKYHCYEVENGYGLALAALSKEEPKYFNDLKSQKEEVLCIGKLLSELDKLRQEIEKNKMEKDKREKHIENLEIMNKDKQCQIDDANAKFKDLEKDQGTVKYIRFVKRILDQSKGKFED
tara:strand:- start:489 stop:1367 length:879 start_codon:yes stop_codon:yes gene_type:complete